MRRPVEGARLLGLDAAPGSSRWLVSIASDLVYGETIRAGETGLIAGVPEDWAAALARLHDDPNLRYRIADSARRHVRTNRMFASQIPRRIDWYQGLLDRRYDLNEQLFRRFPMP